jgi:hypothetical protein
VTKTSDHIPICCTFISRTQQYLINMPYSNRNNNHRNNDYNRDERYYSHNNNNNYRPRQEKRHDNNFGNRNSNRYGDQSYNIDNNSNSRYGYNDSGGNYNNSRQGSWNDGGDGRRYHHQQQQQYDRRHNQSNNNHPYNRKRGRDEAYSNYNDGMHIDRRSGDLKRSRTAQSKLPDTFPPQSKPVLGRSESATIKNDRTKTEVAKDKIILASAVEQTKEQKLAELESRLRFKKVSNSKFELLKYQFKIDGFEQRVHHLDERLAALASM